MSKLRNINWQIIINAICTIINIVVVYVVLKNVHLLEKILGAGGIYILKKFFGIILLAISVKLFTSNLSALLELF